MALADMLLPMLGMGAMDATQQQGPMPPMGTAQQQGAMMPFMDPAAMAQLQTDQLDYQRKNQLANALMSQGYVPNSGKFGVLAGIASMLGGKLAQSQNDSKLSDIVKRQIQAEQEAAQAQHAQQQADLTFKTNEDIRKDNATKGMEYIPGVGFMNKVTGQITQNPDLTATEIATKKTEAENAAAATAKYREAPGAAGAAGLNQIKQIMAMPDSSLKQALMTKALGEGGMQSLQMSSMFGGGAGGGQGGTVQGGPTGEDFLKSLPPAIAGQVKAISEGRQAPPTSMALRSPMGQQLMAAVTQYDPTFDATNYAARSKTRNAFTAGKEGQTMNAINTAIGHAGTLMDAANALDNTSVPLINQGINAYRQGTGDPRVQNFNVARDALAGEITKAFRGSSGSEKDIQEVQQNLSAASSPEQLKAAIQQATHLLGSKVSSLGNQYKAAFGENSQPNLLDPKAQAVLKKLSAQGLDLGELGTDEGVSSGAAAQAAPTATATGPNGQKIGLVNGQWVPL